MEKIIDSGAEATIYLNENKIIKKRIEKKYRHPELDKKLIKRRTKAESKIIQKANKIINTPKIIETTKNSIIMEFIPGEKLSKYLDSYTTKKQKKILFKIGQEIAKLHKNKIIHGDLTTSNIILKNEKIYFIDFGLSSITEKYEQKGADIYLFKQALESKHFKNAKTLFNEFEKGYESIDKNEKTKSFQKFEAIKKRRRYKH